MGKCFLSPAEYITDQSYSESGKWNHRSSLSALCVVFYFDFFSFQLQLTYSIILISGVQQNDYTLIALIPLPLGHGSMRGKIEFFINKYHKSSKMRMEN